MPLGEDAGVEVVESLTSPTSEYAIGARDQYCIPLVHEAADRVIRVKAGAIPVGNARIDDRDRHHLIANTMACKGASFITPPAT